MKKAFLQLLVILSLFFALWFTLSRINFTGELEIQKLTRDNEAKIGELLLDVIRKKDDEIKNDTISKKAEEIVEKICKSNGIKKTSVTVHIIDNSEVNALALPGRHLVIFTGLVNFCKTNDELAGVIAHEIAHMEHDHVMKKLVKEVGLTMLVIIAGGSGGGEIIAEVLRTISSRAFDREQESEADMQAVKLLSNAGIPPTGLSDFLFRLSQSGKEMPDELVFLSTHPGSSERAAAIITEAEKYKNRQPG